MTENHITAEKGTKTTPQCLFWVFWWLFLVGGAFGVQHEGGTGSADPPTFQLLHVLLALCRMDLV